MNLRTYLMIKQAGGFADAVAAVQNNMTPDQKWQQQLDFANNDLKYKQLDNDRLQSDNDKLQSDLSTALAQQEALRKERGQFLNQRNELQSLYDAQSAKRQELEDQANAYKNQLGSLNDKYNAAKERANKVLAQRDQQINDITGQLNTANDNISRMRHNASIGGAVGGAALGGAGGYAGSKWLANKLKLTGRKALAAKLLGTAAGSALLGAGGYYLGQNI